jgi:hypothetical protein
VPGGGALVDAGRQGPHAGHPVGHLLPEQQPAAARTRAFRGVALHPDRPGLQVLADRPAGEVVHHHVGPVAEAADEVPGVALDVDPHPAAQADGEVMAPPGLEHPGGRAVRQGGQRGVDLAGRQLRAAQDHRLHTWISSGIGSKTRAPVISGSPARAWYSEAMAT